MMHGCRKLMLMLEDVDEDEDEDVSSRLLAVSNVPRYGDYYVLPDQRYPKLSKPVMILLSVVPG